ncbi:hypothetical protein ABW21_db0207405 [Orbilia brochopaga]|nr:hypothetical protein ABW21_db0207405 [Drechslerella brochopaga]
MACGLPSEGRRERILSRDNCIDSTMVYGQVPSYSFVGSTTSLPARPEQANPEPQPDFYNFADMQQALQSTGPGSGFGRNASSDHEIRYTTTFDINRATYSQANEKNCQVNEYTVSPLDHTVKAKKPVIKNLTGLQESADQSAPDWHDLSGEARAGIYNWLQDVPEDQGEACNMEGVENC